MYAILTQLQRDHLHLDTLLSCLQDHILRSMQSASEEPINFYLIVDIIDYLQVYPEKWHHPIEQAVYQKLLERTDNETRNTIVALIEEHDLQNNSTKALRHRVLENFKQTQSLTQQDSLLLLQYIERQIIHIQVEERSIFPIVKNTLSPQDWEEINRFILQADDHGITDAAIRKEYDNLYHNITDFHPICSNKGDHTKRCNPFSAATR